MSSQSIPRRVIHISYGDGGGAGRAARRAHAACKAAGVDSYFSFLKRETNEKDGLIIEAAVPNTPLERGLWDFFSHDMQWTYIHDNRTKFSNTLFSVPYPGYDLLNSSLISSCDVIHLHWAAWFASPAAIRSWLDAGKAIVWTLHDFAPMTGGCHYPSSCEQYRDACWKCPQLVDPWELVPNVFVEKLDAYGGHPNLTIISPSRWLADTARRSKVLGNCRVEVVPNAIDTEIFAPAPDRIQRRAVMGLRPNDILLLFGNNDNREKRKGGEVLTKALARLAPRYAAIAAETGLGTLFLAEFGKSAIAVSMEGIRNIYLGEVDDEPSMAEILGLADAYLHPALEDNYPNTIVECLACGTPVIGFPIGGVPDLVKDGVSGLLASVVDSPQSLAETIETFLRKHALGGPLRETSRATVAEANRLDKIGAQLRTLYEDLTPNASAADLIRLAGDAAPPFKKIIVPPTFALGPAARRFPLGQAIARGVTTRFAQLTKEPLDDAAFKEKLRAPAVARPIAKTGLSVLAVRGDHSHLSVYSGGHQFLRDVRRAGVDVVEMLVPIGNEHAADEAAALREPLEAVGSRGFAIQGNAISAELAVLREIRQRHFDVVHYLEADINGWILPGFLRRTARSYRPAIAATLHQPPSVLRNIVSHERLAMFDSVVTLCKEQHDYVEAVRNDAIALIPHGIDTEFFAPSEAPKPSTDPDEPIRILGVGRWLRDYETLFAAVDTLAARGIVVQADVVANLPDREGVTIHRDIDDLALRDLYQQADIFCLPLEDATANNGVLEAMASGLPIISTRTGGLPDCVDDSCAILAEPKDVWAIADAVERLATEPELRRTMGERARERALTYAWPRIAARYIDFYRELAASRPGMVEQDALRWGSG